MNPLLSKPALLFLTLTPLAMVINICCSQVPSQRRAEKARLDKINSENGDETQSGHDTNMSKYASISLSVKHSTKCLDMEETTADKAYPIIQHSCDNRPSQSWKIIPLEDASVRIVSDFTGLCLDVEDSSDGDGASIYQAACNDTASHQRWRFAKGSDDTTQTQNGEPAALMIANNKCLDVENRSTADGASLIQWPCSFDDNQLWTQTSFEAIRSGQVETIENSQKSILSEKTISCSKKPKLSVLATQKWSKDAHGDNERYINFFTPVAHYKASTYWVWLDLNLVPYVSKFTETSEVKGLLAGGYRVKKDPHNIVFSLGIDVDGYIHISGDMQNGPNVASSRVVPKEYREASILYWRSKKPQNVEAGFEFLGASKFAVPAVGVNGIRFFTDNYGALYASAYVKAMQASAKPGLRGVGLYRYKINSRTWEAVGGLAPETSWEKGEKNKRYSVFFWDEGGVAPSSWFQGFFSPFRFDLKNRLHFASSINTNSTLTSNNRLIYAVRENGKWQKVDGSIIPSLPIRAIDKASAQGSLVRNDEKNSFDWTVNVIADKDGKPGVWAETVKDKKYHWFIWNNNKWEDNMSALNNQKPDMAYIAPGGALLMIKRGTAKVACYEKFSTPGVEFEFDGYESFVNGDEYGLKTTGSLFGVAVNRSTSVRSLIRIDYADPLP